MKKKAAGNNLDQRPLRSEQLKWSEEDGSVVLQVENKGVWNRLAQKILKKPKVSYIHLDEMGSFIWPLCNGEQTLFEIGQAVEERFGEDAQPLFERLVTYMQTLESYRFIHFDAREGKGEKDLP